MANDYATGIFAQVSAPGPSSTGEPTIDERMVELLSRVFSATAIVPEGPSESPTNDLQQLAASYTSYNMSGNDKGSQVQLVS
jgi:hypothetical protein